MAKFTELRNFGATCRTGGLSVNGKTIYQFMIDHGFIERYGQLYQGKLVERYQVAKQFRHRTHYPKALQLSEISDSQIQGKLFVQIERVFDPQRAGGRSTTVYLTEAGVAYMLDYIQKLEQADSLQLSFI